MAGDNNYNPMIGLNVGYEFSNTLDGLRLSAHGFQGTVDAYKPDDTLASSTDLNMLGGSAVYLANDWEIMSEYYHFNNKDRIGTNGSLKSWAGYLQVGKEIDHLSSIEIDNLTPFIRLERAALNQADNYFSDQETGRAYTRQAIGVSYLLNQKTALKLELLKSKFEADTIRGTSSINSILAQYAIRF
jgi:hypothetical protein